MSVSAKLDRIDLKILAELQKNGRITNVDLADARWTVTEPVPDAGERLESAGYIAGYGAQLQLRKLGDVLLVFTEVTLSDHRRDDFSRL